MRFLLALALAFAAPLYAQDFTAYGTQPGLQRQLESSNSCSSCHGSGGSKPEAYLPHDGWSGSMMAHAGRDPLFWAALDIANHDVPGIGDWCLRCHAPSGWFAGRVVKNGLGGTVNGSNGCLLSGDHDNSDNSQNDYSGVTCHSCHRMTETGPLSELAPPGSGNLWLDDSLDCNGYFGPCRYGPKRYAEGDVLAPPHGTAYSSFTTGSAQCGSCHDVSSPIVNGAPARSLILADGTDTGRAFPAERTFSEWQQSRFGDAFTVDSFEEPGRRFPARVTTTTCQDCHMRTSQSATARACINNPEGSRVGDVAAHEFVGGNSWVLGIIDRLYGSALGRSAAIQRSITASLEMLQQRSADIAVSLSPLPAGDANLQALVRVTNRAGHKLPTGYGEGRRLWIHLQVHDANDALVYESGAFDAASGDLDLSPEPKIYEVLQGIWHAGSGECRVANGKGEKLFHFALNNCVLKDNRIPPEGFRPATGSDPQGHELGPVAYSYPETTPGSGQLQHYDEAEYTIAVPSTAVRPLRVRATLRYQVASRDYIEFLKRQSAANGQLSENLMCGRSWSVGPGDKTRADFLYDLWADPEVGRSPPVAMVSSEVLSVSAP